MQVIGLSLLLLVSTILAGPSSQDRHAPLEQTQQPSNASSHVLSRSKRGIVDDLNKRGIARCNIRNVLYNEYMYAGSWAHRFIGRDLYGYRSVYTWSGGTKDDDTFDWKFTKYSPGKFYIQNPYYYDEYLITSQARTLGVYDVFTKSYNPPYTNFWNVESYGSNNNMVRIGIRFSYWNSNWDAGALNYLGAKNSFNYRRFLGIGNLTHWTAQNTSGISPDVWQLSCSV